VIDGNYDTYLHFVRQGLAREARADVAAKLAGTKPGFGGPPSGRQSKERRKRKFPYRKAAEIEQETAERESRIDALHQLFASEDVARDGAKVRQLKTELEEHETALPQLYEHWEEAIELNG
jgi:ATP-binding cassette subfamily F protein 3